MAVTFVDRVVLHLSAGAGGHGVASVKREKFKPLGGPDGGNGGHGGSVILRVDPSSTTLLDYHRHPHRKAVNGLPGAGDEKNGADGDDLVLSVPEGTVVKDGEGRIVMDLVGMGTEHVIARGGRGGLGNKALSSARRRAPGFALLGEPGEEVDVVLELKTLADVALIGFPSAGKSSLVSVLSAAKPKIADYPFTTLVPNLGVVTAGSSRFTVADVPGLIPGAHEGKGLGLEFLRHVERCSVLVHVIDCATLEPGRDPMSDLDVIENELSLYVPDADLGGRPLSERTRIVVLNKADVPEARELAEMVKPDLEARGIEVFIVSAVAHEGLRELSFAMARHVDAARTEIGEAVPKRVVLRPRSVNDEAGGYLADRLGRLGVEDELYKVGAVAGDTVVIGATDDAVVFDWEPTLQAGAELLGSRGTDLRLSESARPTRDEKREAQKDRYAARAATQEELAAERRSGLWHVAADEDDDA